MVQEVKQKYNGGTEWMLPDGYGRASRGWGKLWLSLVQTVTHPGGPLDPSHPLSSSSTMRVVLLALRLMCMAWFWPVTQLNSSHFPNKRRHKEQYVGETAKPKHGGWANVFFSMCLRLVSQHCKQNYIQSFHLNDEGGKRSDQDV